MTNFTRLRKLSKSEMAEELNRIRKDVAFPYVDFAEWLQNSDARLIPHGRKVKADIYIRHSQTHRIVDIDEMECIVLSDKDTLFGSRFYSVWDFADGKIKSVPFDCFEITEVM